MGLLGEVHSLFPVIINEVITGFLNGIAEFQNHTVDVDPSEVRTASLILAYVAGSVLYSIMLQLKTQFLNVDVFGNVCYIFFSCLLLLGLIFNWILFELA